jgi:hypothetical protein
VTELSGVCSQDAAGVLHLDTLHTEGGVVASSYQNQLCRGVAGRYSLMKRWCFSSLPVLSNVCT